MATANPTMEEVIVRKIASFLVAKSQPIIKHSELRAIFEAEGYGDKELSDFTSYIQTQEGRAFFRNSVRLELWKAGYRP